MNSKFRFIPLVVIGAIILSLLAVVPAFSATGMIRFYEDADTDQEWARVGGEVKIELTDSDLDVPIKYVLLTGRDLEKHPGRGRD